MTYGIISIILNNSIKKEGVFLEGVISEVEKIFLKGEI